MAENPQGNAGGNLAPAPPGAANADANSVRRPLPNLNRLRRIFRETPRERRILRRIRMQCINRVRTAAGVNGRMEYVFYCRACMSEFRSPFRWGGNRKTAHADTLTHRIYFESYAEQNGIEYPPHDLHMQLMDN